MKKNKLLKLSLNRETIHALEDGAIQAVVGGLTARTCGNPCSAACTVNPCYEASDRCSYTYPCTK